MSGTTPEMSNPTPRTRETSPPLLLGNQRGVDDQLTEGVNACSEESDPPILLRDGRTDHMGKRRAVSQSGHSTHARETNAPMRSVSSTLSALARKAEDDKKHRFKSLYSLIDLQMLYESFRGLKRNAAPGLDGITVADYEKDLDENLRSLHRRLIEKCYRAQNVKRRYISKPGSKKLRPLGIPTLEDKMAPTGCPRSHHRSSLTGTMPPFAAACHPRRWPFASSTFQTMGISP